MPRGARAMRWLFNLWPPFLFAGIRVLAIAPDWGYVRVRLRRRWFNRNYVGTHFGGSLFAMTDPFWMIMILQALGRDYLVWDRAARIEFVQATRADVYAEFRLDPALVEELRRRAADGSKGLHWLPIEVRTADGTVVARIEKQLYVRLKKHRRPNPTNPLAEPV
jgi:acyl-coenzyme A thioesterase PaaI-like protein